MSLRQKSGSRVRLLLAIGFSFREIGFSEQDSKTAPRKSGSRSRITLNFYTNVIGPTTKFSPDEHGTLACGTRGSPRVVGNTDSLLHTHTEEHTSDATVGEDDEFEIA